MVKAEELDSRQLDIVLTEKHEIVRCNIDATVKWLLWGDSLSILPHVLNLKADND